jgi:F420-non-reducing hydrogenase iron-sulfur subunit
MLEDFGLEPERFRLEWIASSEAQKFADVITNMTESLKALGPSSYNSRG